MCPGYAEIYNLVECESVYILGGGVSAINILPKG